MERFLIFLTALYFLISLKTFSQASGDFVIYVPVTMTSTVTMQTVSIPFECATNPGSLIAQYNRLYPAQYGTYWKIFTANESYQYQIAYLKRLVQANFLISDM